MINEFLTNRNTGWLEAQGNFYLLKSTSFDSGGKMDREERNYFSSPVDHRFSNVIMKDNSKLVIGGNWSLENPSLMFRGHNIQNFVTTARFSGNGFVDFASTTGAAVAPAVEDVVPIYLVATNTVDTSSWSKTSGNVINVPQDISTFTLYASGNLTVNGDMSAKMYAESGRSQWNYNIYGSPILTPNLSPVWSRLDYIPDYTTDPVSYIDFGSNNKFDAAAFRSGSNFKVTNNFTGYLSAVTSYVEISKLYNSGNINNNSFTTHGVWTNNALEIAGKFSGSIYSEVSNIILANDLTKVKADGAVNVNHSGNTFAVYGLNAGTSITLNGFEANTSVDNIVGKLNNIVISPSNQAGNNPTVNTTNNTFGLYGISGNNITVNGVFNGSIDLSAYALQVNPDSWGGTWTSGNNLDMFGLKANNITFSGNMNGKINLDFNNFAGTYSNGLKDYYKFSTNNWDIKGISAQNLTVTGILSSEISIRVDMNSSSQDTNYICGIYTNILTASALGGNIYVNSLNGNMNTIGLYVTQGAYNNLAGQGQQSTNDDVLDLIGDIYVNGANTSIGVMGFMSAGMNIRVSGSIVSVVNETNLGYAFFAGELNNNGTHSRTGTDDRVEIAAGGVIIGHIELFNANNSLIIDSNARVFGTVSSNLGTNNLEIVLNDFAMSGVKVADGWEDDAIITSPAALESINTFTVNLNGVDLSNGPKTYILYEGLYSSDWQDRTISVKYQGIRGTVSAEGGEYRDTTSGLYVTSEYFNNQLALTVHSLPTTGQLISVSGLTNSIDLKKQQVTLSWNMVGANSYEVEYRIDGSNTIVQIVNNKTSIVLSGIEGNQKVEWRVRQNVGNGDQTSAWSEEKTVVMSVTEDDYVYSKVYDVDYIAGSAASNSTSLLSWKAGEEYSEGVQKFAVRYFQSLTRLDSGAIDWDNTAHVVKYVTNTELMVTGLTNLEYFYWQVCAVDNAGRGEEKAENWVDGNVFRVYADDTTPPWFVDPANTVTAVTIWQDPSNFSLTETNTMDVSLTWDRAYDDRSGVSRYRIRFRLAGSSDAWTVIEIPVLDDSQMIYSFRLSEYIKNNPNSGLTLLKNGNYEVELTATDYAGMESDVVKKTWQGDNTAPFLRSSSVQGASSWVDVANDLSVNLTWDPATDNGANASNILRYELRYRTVSVDAEGNTTYGAWITQILNSKQTSWSGRLNSSTDYQYEITAYDVAGNASDTTSGIWKTDDVAPVFGSPDLHTVDNVYTASSKTNVVTFTWSEASDISLTVPNSGVSVYEVVIFQESDAGRRDFYTIRVPKSELSLTITVSGSSQYQLQDGTYSWEISVYDNAGNKTTHQGEEDFTIDTQGPTGSFLYLSASYDLSYTITETSSGNIIWSGIGGTGTSIGGTTTQKTVTDISVEFVFENTYTDATSEVYFVVQISDSQFFNSSRTSEFITTGSSLVLDNTNGFGAGAISGMSQVYWRVQAMDSMGNMTGYWSVANPMTFNYIDSNETPVDKDKPTDVAYTYVDSVRSNNVSLSWSASSDVWGVKYYEIQYKLGSQTYTAQVSAENTSTTLSGLKDGVYSWSVRAVDYVGNTSAWTSATSGFTVDTIAPVFDINSTSIISVVGSKDVCFSWKAATDANLAGYRITVTNAEGRDYTYTVNDSKATTFWVYSLANGSYTYTIVAFDSSGNTSASSTPKTFWVDTSADPGSTFATALALDWSKASENSVGKTDTSDMFKLTLDGASSVALTISGLATLEGKAAGVKVTVYNPNHKKLKTFTAKTNQKLSAMLWDFVSGKGDYYVEVTSTNKNSVVKYTLSAEQNLFPAKTSNVSFGSAETLKLTEHYENKGSGSVSDWVGYGDAADYFKLDMKAAGTSNLTITGVTGKLKITVYNSAHKKLKSITVNGNKTLFTNLLTPLGSYIVVESGDKGKGKQNSYYTLNVNTDYFQAASSNSSFGSAEAKTLTVDTDKTAYASVSGWVGYGDPSDYYKFNASGPGSTSISINGISAGTKLKVTMFDAAMKKVKSWTVKSNNQMLYSNQLTTGDFYIVVESGDKGKGKQNSEYTVNVVTNYYPGKSSNNSVASATKLDLSDTGKASVNDWVGYGDAKDYFSFELSEASKVDLNLSPTTSGIRVGKELKIAMYDAAGKKVKLDSALTSVDSLAAGKYSIVVEISNEKKFNSSYLLSAAIA